jgi:hypothetical protein
VRTNCACSPPGPLLAGRVALALRGWPILCVLCKGWSFPILNGLGFLDLDCSCPQVKPNLFRQPALPTLCKRRKGWATRGNLGENLGTFRFA